MIRYTLLSILIAGFCLYSFKDWYKSLCALIVFTAVYQHPDIRGSMLGIQGLNPWNLLFIFVFMGWLLSRGKEGLRWDMPQKIGFLLAIYLILVLIGFYRFISDSSGVIKYAIATTNDIPSAGDIWSEYLVNTIKWVIPGIMLYDGCRDSSRFKLAVFAVVAIYFLLAVQVIRWMPLSSFVSGDELSHRSGKILQNEIGYNRVNLSALLAGGSWAIFSITAMMKNKLYSRLLIMGGITVIFAQCLTGGRAGYMAFFVLSIVLCILKWRKYAVLLLASITIIAFLIPGVTERVTSGISDTKSTSNSSSLDLYAVTSGRNIAWPYEIAKIEDSPWIGYGRMSMQRTGISEHLWVEYMESFPHPHNAYLEWILDNGVIGFIPILIFYIILLKYCLTLLLDNRNSEFIAIGGISFALIFSLMVASLGSQTFYPREGSVGMWCAIGLMLRVYVERSRAMNTAESKTEGLGSLIWKK